MIENTTRAKLQAGETVLGTFFKYAEPALAEYVAMQGWDFMIFDGEHGTLQPRDIEDLCRAAELRNVTPISRATTNDTSIILRFMDAGSHGIHVPWVNTPEGVEAAVQAVKYWPRGQRGLAGTRAAEWGLSESLGDYTERANRETMVIIHIETIEAVDAVDAYLEIDGVDVCFLGPTDLSHSLGHPGNAAHPEVIEAMERVAAAVVPSDKTLGIFAANADFAATWIERGARYIATGTDGFLKNGMQEYLAELRA